LVMPFLVVAAASRRSMPGRLGIDEEPICPFPKLLVVTPVLVSFPVLLNDPFKGEGEAKQITS